MLSYTPEAWLGMRDHTAGVRGNGVHRFLAAGHSPQERLNDELRRRRTDRLSFLIVRKNTILAAEEIPGRQVWLCADGRWRNIGDLLKHIAWSPMLYEDMHITRRLRHAQGYDFSAIFGSAWTKSAPS